jgi:hypothetical protein
MARNRRRGARMFSTFAVIPDQSDRPTAFFPELEDALQWALERYGSDRFVIRGYQLAGRSPPRVAADRDRPS